MKRKIKCPYQINKDCDKLEVDTMTLSVNCSDCNNYNNGIRHSKGVYIPNFKSFWNKYNIAIIQTIIIFAMIIAIIILVVASGFTN